MWCCGWSPRARREVREVREVPMVRPVLGGLHRRAAPAVRVEPRRLAPAVLPRHDGLRAPRGPQSMDSSSSAEMSSSSVSSISTRGSTGVGSFQRVPGSTGMPSKARLSTSWLRGWVRL